MNEEELPPCQQDRPGKIDFGTDCSEWCEWCCGSGRYNRYERIDQMLQRRLLSINCDRCGFFFYSQRTLDRHTLFKHAGGWSDIDGTKEDQDGQRSVGQTVADVST